MNDKPFRLAAALAYYTLFSLAPLLVVALAIAGLAFGEEAVRGDVFGHVRGLVGDQSAGMIQPSGDPDVSIPWEDVWIGAAATSALFTLGKAVIGFYLGGGAVASAYGAASSVVVLLMWIYYSSLILYFGAEFTQVYATNVGSKAASGARGASS